MEFFECFLCSFATHWRDYRKVGTKRNTCVQRWPDTQASWHSREENNNKTTCLEATGECPFKYSFNRQIAFEVYCLLTDLLSTVLAVSPCFTLRSVCFSLEARNEFPSCPASQFPQLENTNFTCVSKRFSKEKRMWVGNTYTDISA